MPSDELFSRSIVNWIINSIANATEPEKRTHAVKVSVHRIRNSSKLLYVLVYGVLKKLGVFVNKPPSKAVK